VALEVLHKASRFSCDRLRWTYTQALRIMAKRPDIDAVFTDVRNAKPLLGSELISVLFTNTHQKSGEQRPLKRSAVAPRNG